MAKVFLDRAMAVTTTTGTGDITIGAAVTGHVAPTSATNDTFDYVIFAVDGSGVPTGDWETGVGTFTSATTFSRSVSKSSNSDALVSFAAGDKHVAATAIGDTLTNLLETPIGVSLGRTATQSLPSTTDTAVVWDTELRNTDGMYDPGTSTTRITIPSDGWYLINSHLQFDSTSNYNIRHYINGTVVQNLDDYAASTNEFSNTVLHYFSAGDYVEVYARKGTTGSTTMTARVAATKLSAAEGPAVLATKELIKTYDFSVDGAVSEIDVSAAELGDWDELHIFGRLETSSSVDVRLLVSDDDLASVYSTLGDYQAIHASTGADEATTTLLAYSGTASGAAKSIGWEVVRAGGQLVSSQRITEGSVGRARRFVGGAAADVDSFRIRPDAGTIDGGTLEIYKVRYSAAQSLSGTAFPVAPTTNQRFYRTDLSMEFFYDGTRWLSTQLFTMELDSPLSTQGWTATSGAYQRNVNPHYGSGMTLWIEDIVSHLVVTGTGNWTINIYAAGGTLMRSHTVTAYDMNRYAYNAERNEDYFYFTVTENSGSGTFYAFPSFTYRLIAT